MLKKFIIPLQEKSYPIIIGIDIFNNNDIFSYFKKNKRYILITNSTLLNIWVKKIIKIFKIHKIYIEIISIPDGERFKSLKEVNYIITELLKKNCGRDTVLIAFGGGVIGDITGFVASIYQRGIEFIQIPTTLLSQVDASVGGKTGVNHILGKNMIGTFFQPKNVIIDLLFLSTLPKKELFSGFSEVVKYSIIFDKKFFLWLENNFLNLIKLNKKCLFYCIKRCCQLKAKVISIDEKEHGCRALLNFGHTYGHAIESYLGYKNILHGEAVSIGMVIASRTSEIFGFLNNKNINRIISLLKKFNLPVIPPYDMPLKKYIFYMKKDKKNIFGNIRLILPYKIGVVKIYDNVTEKIIFSAVTNSLKNKI
ncbi:3-dehydroquinate synthase [Buchnera aphidicola (Periphyllus testudinaceus)]|uniref:3-dehydroquinate synthase n=1 Tax=Buchnera aphidicola TaxID=9 RepID=UPI0034646D24